MLELVYAQNVESERTKRIEFTLFEVLIFFFSLSLFSICLCDRLFVGITIGNGYYDWIYVLRCKCVCTCERQCAQKRSRCSQSHQLMIMMLVLKCVCCCSFCVFRLKRHQNRFFLLIFMFRRSCIVYNVYVEGRRKSVVKVQMQKSAYTVRIVQWRTPYVFRGSFRVQAPSKLELFLDLQGFFKSKSEKTFSEMRV